MRKALFNLHLWTAMIAGVFLLILGVTGALLAFEPQIDHLLNPGIFYVQPQAETVPVSELFDSVRKTFPKNRPSMIMFAPTPGISALVVMRGLSVYVDPYTGRVVGTRKGRPFMQMIHELHLRLLIGRPGEYIMSWSTVVLIFLTITGIYLWWPLKRVTIAGRKSWRRFNFDTHYAVGFYSSLFLLILSVTGVIVGFGDYAVPAMYHMTHSEPADDDVASTPAEGAAPISVDKAVAVAQTALPDTSLVSVMPPRGAEGVFRIAFRYPEDRTPGGRSRVLVDQFSGKILFVESSRTAPAGTRLVNLNRALHTGDIGGMPAKVLLCLMSLAVVVQAFTGVVMWWKRRSVPQRAATAPMESVSA